MAASKNNLNESYNFTNCIAYQENSLARRATMSKVHTFSRCLIGTNVLVGCIAVVGLMAATAALTVAAIGLVAGHDEAPSSQDFVQLTAIGNLSGGSATYTRWGSSSCPSTLGTQLVYSGRVGGSFFSHQGGGSNYLCMPDDPEYTLQSSDRLDRRSALCGAEYESPIIGTRDTNVPCAVCHVTARQSVLMIPAKTSCPLSWTEEYEGYLMSQSRENDQHRTMFECVDRGQEAVPGTRDDTDGALFYHVEIDCSTGLPCPPYSGRKQVNCVVCSK